MAEHSKIEWTDATWNPITGCSVVSPGCARCYAMKLAGTRMQHHWSRQGLTEASKAGPVWNGAVRFNAEWLGLPLRWKRPRRIFVCAHGDLFHEAAPDAWIDQVFAVMALCPQHTFQVLTKRAARMRAYLTAEGVGRRIALAAHPMLPAIERGPTVSFESWRGIGMAVRLPMDWVWLGVSAEDQARANKRIPELLATPAAVRFLSAEPLLGPIDLRRLDTFYFPGCERVDALGGTGSDFLGVEQRGVPSLDWVIAGGESGPGARPMHPDWARQLRDDCQRAGVPFFFKQWGEWSPDVGPPQPPRNDTLPLAAWLGDRWRTGVFDITGVAYDDLLLRYGKKEAGRALDGRTHDAMPEAARA